MRGNMGIHVKIIANSFLSEALYEEGCGLDHYNTMLVFGEGKEEEEEEEEMTHFTLIQPQTNIMYSYIKFMD